MRNDYSGCCTPKIEFIVKLYIIIEVFNHQAMITPTMFNNQKYSDVAVLLSDQSSLFAHRIIISEISDVMITMIDYASKDSNQPTLSFPDHSDYAVKFVIESAYKTSLFCGGRDMHYDEWLSTLYFAHYLNYKKLIDVLIYAHPFISCEDLIKIASELNVDRLFEEVAINMDKRMYDKKEVDNAMKEICSLSWDDFCKIHNNWPDQTFTAFAVAHQYCISCFEDNKTAYERLITLCYNIKFYKFVRSELQLCLIFPILKNTVLKLLLNNLLKTDLKNYQNTNSAMTTYLDC